MYIALLISAVQIKLVSLKNLLFFDPQKKTTKKQKKTKNPEREPTIIARRNRLWGILCQGTSDQENCDKRECDFHLLR
jgi:hypothetical protein